MMRAATFGQGYSTVIPENQGMAAAGSSLLNAFYRLEVVEYSARSLIDTAAIGQHVPIGKDDIRALGIAFSLD